MKLPRIPLLISLCVFLILAGIFIPSQTQAQSPYFEEYFNDPSLPEWSHTEAAYVLDGELVLDEGGFAHHPENWSNLNLSFRATFSGQGELIIHYKSGYYLLFNGDRFYLQQSEDDEIFSEISEPVHYPLPPGEWFQVEIFVEGESHLIQINQDNIYAVVLPDPLPPGGISFEVVGDASIRIDDLSVLNLENIDPPDPTLSVTETNIPELQTQEVSPTSTVTDQSQLTWIRTGGPPGGLGYDIRYNFDVI